MGRGFCFLCRFAYSLLPLVRFALRLLLVRAILVNSRLPFSIASNVAANRQTYKQTHKHANANTFKQASSHVSRTYIHITYMHIVFTDECVCVYVRECVCMRVCVCGNSRIGLSLFLRNLQTLCGMCISFVYIQVCHTYLQNGISDMHNV